MSPVETIVVKVGGSLYDLPDLGPRLRAWLAELDSAVLLIPGGGAGADVVRDLDCLHGLGEEASHWLALRALGVNAAFLAALLPGVSVIEQPQSGRAAPGQPSVAVLTPEPFVHKDEGRPGCLPHTWNATSDAVAARVAVVARASRLILLKSVAVPDGLCWTEAARLGLVDSVFPAVLAQSSALRVTAVNLRTWEPRPAAPPGPGHGRP